MSPLVIRNVEVEGRAGLDVRIESGRIAEIGWRLAGAGDELDAKGGALIPGLVDHHIHLMALAAQAQSVTLEGVTSPAEFRTRLSEALPARPVGAWLRVTGYHETMAGALTRGELDGLAPHHALRLQHQTGSLWMLNSQALARLRVEEDPAPCIERDGQGRATGRIWRGDAWLRARLSGQAPPLAPVGRQLSAFGITAVTDASATSDADAAAKLAEAFRARELPQRLRLMSAGALDAPADGAFAVGAVKILLDDHDLPELDAFIARIALARSWGRAVAVHCVTAAQLALALAAFEAAGTVRGDRIEHGSVIPKEAIAQLRALGLAVVTQPAFICERGDRYAAEIEPREHADLYRCRSLLEAAVPLAAGSDAPYAAANPWHGIAAAAGRRTRSGRALGEAERIGPAIALCLYLQDPESPGRILRKLCVGAEADLCLLKVPLAEALEAPDAALVRATLIGGELVYSAA